MAIPTYKNPELNKFLSDLTGRDRVKSIEQNTCTTCGKPATEFKDALSEKEYRISGMCQECQDSVFDI